MFKMGCSMARRILTPGSATSGDQQQAGCFSTAQANSSSSGNNNNNNSNSNKNSGRNADQANTTKTSQPSSELDDFSKLKEDPRLPLNVRQIFKITKSWKAIARTTSKTGTAMFLALFEQNENLFHLFDRFQHLKGKELHESMELREHAATVMATLDTSINSLSDYDNFVSYLHSIGQLHRKVPGFKREYFWEIEQPFMKAVKQTLDERCNETIEEIYKIAIKLIIETIAVGYGKDQDNGQGNAPDAPDKSRQGGGGSDGNTNKKSGASEEDSNKKSEKKPAEFGRSGGGGGGGGGGGQRARQCQQTPSEMKMAPNCPLVVQAEQVRCGLETGTNKSVPDHRGGQPKSTGQLVRAICKLMSATETLARGCGEIRLDEQDQSERSEKAMNWRSLLANLNRSLMNEADKRTKVEQQNNGHNQAKQRRHRSARSFGASRVGCPVMSLDVSEHVASAPDGNEARDLHDDGELTHLEAGRVADAAHRELDRNVQLGHTQEGDEKKRPSRAIDPIESQATNWASDSRQTAAQDKLEKCPSLREHRDEEQTLSGFPRGRPTQIAGWPADAKFGDEPNKALLFDSEMSLRRLLLDIKQAENSLEVVDAELIEFIKVIILISKLVLALASSKAVAMKQVQTTLATTFSMTTSED